MAHLKSIKPKHHHIAIGYFDAIEAHSVLFVMEFYNKKKCNKPKSRQFRSQGRGFQRCFF